MSDLNKILIQACMTSDIKKVKSLFEESGFIDVNYEDGTNSNSPLMYACKYGNIDIVKFLVLEKNADVDCRNNKGDNVLIVSSHCGNLPIFRFLIEEGEVDINSTNIDGTTPLMIASHWGYMEIVEYIIENTNVELEIKNNKGLTFFDYLNEEYYHRIKKLLRDIEERKKMVKPNRR